MTTGKFLAVFIIFKLVSYILQKIYLVFLMLFFNLFRLNFMVSRDSIKWQQLKNTVKKNLTC
jgi:hypothetical protein